MLPSYLPLIMYAYFDSIAPTWGGTITFGIYLAILLIAVLASVYVFRLMAEDHGLLASITLSCALFGVGVIAVSHLRQNDVQHIGVDSVKRGGRPCQGARLGEVAPFAELDCPCGVTST